MMVYAHIGGSLLVSALLHQQAVYQHNAVQCGCCCGCHHVVARAAVNLGQFLFGRNHVEQLSAQHLAMAHHRGIEQTYEVAVGRAAVETYLGSRVGERLRTTHAHHARAYSVALLLQFCRHPDVVLVAHGNQFALRPAHGREEVGVDAHLCRVLNDAHRHALGRTVGILVQHLHGFVGAAVVLHYYLAGQQRLCEYRVELFAQMA